MSKREWGEMCQDFCNHRRRSDLGKLKNFGFSISLTSFVKYFVWNRPYTAKYKIHDFIVQKQIFIYFGIDKVCFLWAFGLYNQIPYNYQSNGFRFCFHFDWVLLSKCVTQRTICHCDLMMKIFFIVYKFVKMCHILLHCMFLGKNNGGKVWERERLNKMLNKIYYHTVDFLFVCLFLQPTDMESISQ